MNLAFRVFALCYAAALGGCLGSFLNVAVWRLPAGKSLIRPASFCPKCGHPIRFYDNIPIFGWLFLRGKCRDCRQPISFRYPAVEGAVALMGTVLALLFFFGGRGVPAGVFRWSGLAASFNALAAYEAGETFFAPVSFEAVVLTGLGEILLWLCLLCIILGFALARLDGHRLSPALAAGMICAAFLLLGEAGLIPALGAALWHLAAAVTKRARKAAPLVFFILFFATLTGIVFFYGNPASTL